MTTIHRSLQASTAQLDGQWQLMRQVRRCPVCNSRATDSVRSYPVRTGGSASVVVSDCPSTPTCAPGRTLGRVRPHPSHNSRGRGNSTESAPAICHRFAGRAVERAACCRLVFTHGTWGELCTPPTETNRRGMTQADVEARHVQMQDVQQTSHKLDEATCKALCMCACRRFTGVLTTCVAQVTWHRRSSPPSKPTTRWRCSWQPLMQPLPLPLRM